MIKDLKWIDENRNFIITSLTGCGKTALATAMAVAAMKQGYPALFLRYEELEANLNARTELSLLNYLKRLKRFRVLVIDDFGLNVIRKKIANKILSMLEESFTASSIILTSQL